MSDLISKMDLIRQYLDLRVASNSIYSSNIANSETPGYKAKIPSFESTLEKVRLPDTNATQDRWKLGMRINTSRATPKEDGNNVKLDQQMSQLSENSLLYASAIQILNRESAITKYALNNSR